LSSHLSLQRAPRQLHSFPTRRSSDLFLLRKLADPVDKQGSIRQKHDEWRSRLGAAKRKSALRAARSPREAAAQGGLPLGGAQAGDRKSTRLNSSHGSISYAVFCLKKK